MSRSSGASHKEGERSTTEITEVRISGGEERETRSGRDSNRTEVLKPSEEGRSKSTSVPEGTPALSKAVSQNDAGKSHIPRGKKRDKGTTEVEPNTKADKPLNHEEIRDIVHEELELRGLDLSGVVSKNLELKKKVIGRITREQSLARLRAANEGGVVDITKIITQVMDQFIPPITEVTAKPAFPLDGKYAPPSDSEEDDGVWVSSPKVKASGSPNYSKNYKKKMRKGLIREIGTRKPRQVPAVIPNTDMTKFTWKFPDYNWKLMRINEKEA